MPRPVGESGPTPQNRSPSDASIRPAHADISVARDAIQNLAAEQPRTTISGHVFQALVSRGPLSALKLFISWLVKSKVPQLCTIKGAQLPDPENLRAEWSVLQSQNPSNEKKQLFLQRTQAIIEDTNALPNSALFTPQERIQCFTTLISIREDIKQTLPPPQEAISEETPSLITSPPLLSESPSHSRPSSPTSLERPRSPSLTLKQEIERQARTYKLTEIATRHGALRGSFKETLSAVRSSIDVQLQELGESKSNLEKALDHSESFIRDTLGEDISSKNPSELKREISDLKKKIQEKEDIISSLNGFKSEVKEDIQTLEALLPELYQKKFDEIKDLQTKDLESKNQDIQKLDTEITKKTRELQEIQQQITQPNLNPYQKEALEEVKQIQTRAIRDLHERAEVLRNNAKLLNISDEDLMEASQREVNAELRIVSLKEHLEAIEKEINNSFTQQEQFKSQKKTAEIQLSHKEKADLLNVINQEMSSLTTEKGKLEAVVKDFRSSIETELKTYITEKYGKEDDILQICRAIEADFGVTIEPDFVKNIFQS